MRQGKEKTSYTAREYLHIKVSITGDNMLIYISAKTYIMNYQNINKQIYLIKSMI
jgi:hypothetical protein